MTEFKELSSEDQQKVIQFIESNILKHFREHQVYIVKVDHIDDDPGIDLNESEEAHEADAEEVWYECILCGEETEMDEPMTIEHAMEHLGMIK